MSSLRYISSLVLTLGARPAPPGPQLVSLALGDRNIAIPSPAEFHRIDELAPEVLLQLQAYVPAENRVLGVFVDEADLGRLMKGEPPELKRYMMIQSYRQAESVSVSSAAFAKLVVQLKSQSNSLGDIAADKLKSIAELVSEIEVVGDAVHLGTFMDKADAFGSAALVKLRMTVDDRSHDLVIANTTSFLRVNERVLFAYVYSHYNTPADIEWARKTSTTWSDQILVANVEQDKNGGGDRNDAPASSVWDGVLEKGAAGAIAAVFLSLLISAAYGVKSLLFKKRE